MKIRAGFVSNSSSTSFCLYGVLVKDPKKLKKKLGLKENKEKSEPYRQEGCEHNFDRSKIKFCPECGLKAWDIIEIDEDEGDDYEMQEELSEKLTEMGFDSEMWSGGDNCAEGLYFGKSLGNNTKLDELRDIEVEIKKITNEPIQFFSDSGYN